MELHVAEPGNIVESVRITKVEESRSEAVMTQIGEDATGPLVGWKLSTQAPPMGSSLYQAHLLLTVVVVEGRVTTCRASCASNIPVPCTTS